MNLNKLSIEYLTLIKYPIKERTLLNYQQMINRYTPNITLDVCILSYFVQNRQIFTYTKCEKRKKFWKNVDFYINLKKNIRLL